MWSLARRRWKANASHLCFERTKNGVVAHDVVGRRPTIARGLLASRPHAHLLVPSVDANVFRHIIVFAHSRAVILASWKSIVEALVDVCKHARKILRAAGRAVPSTIDNFVKKPTSTARVPLEHEFDALARDWQALVRALATSLGIRLEPHVEAAGIYAHYVKARLYNDSRALTTKMFVSPDVLWSFVVRAKTITSL